MRSGFGVWYDGGGFECGWLAEEGRHGRSYSIECSTLEEAQQVADRQTALDADCVYVAAAFNEDHEKLFRRARKIVNRRRLEKANSDLQRARAAVKDDDEDTRSTFEKTLADD
jgi:hypothetical protein